MINISAAQARPFTDHVNDMLATLRRLGPSPLKKMRKFENAEITI
jgi:coenzyme F420-reducing hydrogenase delta subunit